MKKLILTFFLMIAVVVFSMAQSSKIVYSNAMTHFYLTCYANDTAKSYVISETSVPLKNVWRLTDREETQVLKTFSEEDVKSFLNQTLEFAEKEQLNTQTTIQGITVSYKKIYGIKCIQFTNPVTKVQFNCNKKTIIKAIEALTAYSK